MGRPLTRRVVLAAAAVVCVLAVAAGLAERGQAAPGPVQLVSIGKFNQPTFVTAPPGDTARVFVVEKQGTVEVLHDGVVSKFLDITSRVTTSGTEQGLLSIAFDPNYATNGLLYADYTTKSPSGDLEIDEFHGDNAGLVVAELELDHASAAFPRPAWLGREVSDVARYYNLNLATHPFSSWSADERGSHEAGQA